MHLALLENISRELMFDALSERIRAEIIRQSKSIVNLNHAFDLLEVSESVLELSESKVNTIEYIRENLDWYQTLKDNLDGRSFSNQLVQKLQSILLGNLLKSWPDSYYRSKKKEAMEIAKELENQL